MDPNAYRLRKQTLKVLQAFPNPVASHVLSIGLRNGNAVHRRLALQGLMARDDSVAARCILQNFDRLEPDDMPLIKPKAERLEPFLLEILRDSNSASLPCAMRAATWLQNIPAITELIAIAEDSSHASSKIAITHLHQLALQMGQNARLNGDKSIARVRLLQLLMVSATRFSDHGSTELIEAFLGCMHWDDAILQTILCDESHPLFTLIQHYLETSRQTDILELLAGFLWRKNAPPIAIKILSQRSDRDLGLLLGTMAQRGLNASARHHLSLRLTPASVLQIQPDDEAVSLEVRCGVGLMLAYSDAPPQLVLHAAIVALKNPAPCAQETARLIIMHYRRLTPIDIVQALAERTPRRDPAKFKVPSLRESLVQLMVNFPRVGKPMQAAIAGFLEDFTFDELFQNLNDWPTDHLRIFACIVRILHPEWPDLMHRQVTSPSPKIRSRGLRTVRLLGLTDGLWSDAVDLTRDYHDQVRIEAVETVGASPRDETLRILTSLARDASTEVCQKARVHLTRIVNEMRSKEKLIPSSETKSC